MYPLGCVRNFVSWIFVTKLTPLQKMIGRQVLAYFCPGWETIFHNNNFPMYQHVITYVHVRTLLNPHHTRTYVPRTYYRDNPWWMLIEVLLDNLTGGIISHIVRYKRYLRIREYVNAGLRVSQTFDPLTIRLVRTIHARE